MGARLLLLATPAALLAGGWVIFYVLKEPPEVDRCALEPARGIDAYREGLGAYATFAAVVISVLIARTSPTRRTTSALAACAWLAALYHLENDTLAPHSLIGLGILVFGGELILLLSAIATFTTWERAARLVYLWMTLLLVLPAAVGYPASEGTPGLCM